MNLEEIYKSKCELSSDINEHLPTLKRYTEDCEHITEMGVRWVVSTYAFMMGKPKKLISIDIDPIERHGISVEYLTQLGNDNGIDFKFILSDTLTIEIEETDLLFLDTLHTYNQVKGELSLHSNKVRKYIIFHDTTHFAFSGMNGDPKGIWPAITEFLDENPQWSVCEKFENNNGLTIIKKS
jgi:hypothetical protein